MGDNDNTTSSQVNNSEEEILKDNVITSSSSEEPEEGGTVSCSERKSIIYCGVCSAPPEYCSYNQRKIQTRCIQWLNSTHPSLYSKLHSKSLEDMLKDLDLAKDSSETSSSTSSTVPNEGESSSTNIESEENKEDEEEGKKSKKKSKRGGGLKPIKPVDSGDTGGPVRISTEVRNKKKRITMISGLDSYSNIKLKDVSKALGKKFATGASVSTEAGKQVIVIQGEVPGETVDFLVSKFDVPEENISIDE